MKTFATFSLIAACVLSLLTACSSTIATPSDTASDPADTAYRKITSAEGKELLQSGTAFTLVDVRRADEYEATHIPGAINVPNESIASTPPDALPDLGQTVVVYCRTGVRSRQAADKLVGMGYTDVRDMGGIADWPYETVHGAQPGVFAATEG